MAIAFDFVTGGAFQGSSWSHTCSGSERLLFVLIDNGGGTAFTNVTYNGVALTSLGVSNHLEAWYLIGPATGAHTVALTGVAPNFQGLSVSYTGCAHDVVPDAQHASIGTATSWTETVTSVAANCWTVLFTNNTVSAPSAGAGSTYRINGSLNNITIWDSNAALTAGSNSMSVSAAGSVTWASVIISFAPFVTAAFAADSTFGFATLSTLKATARFASDSTFGLSTTVQLSGFSRFAADSTFGFSTIVSLLAPGLSVLVNGVDVTTYTRRYESEITETRNQGAAQASIVVRGITPIEGQQVTISDGFSNIFDGQIVRVKLIKRRNGTRVRYRLECDGWGRLFDRRLVYDVETATNIDTIVTHLVAVNTSGFTTTSVQSGLAAANFKANGDRLTQCLSRLAGLINAVFRILPSKDVYFRTSTSLTAPTALSTTNKRFRDLQYDRAIGDLRTRVYAKGASTSVLTDVLVSQQSVPLQSIALFSGAALIILDGIRYSASNFQSGGIGTTLSSSATAGDTTLNLTSTINFTSTGWALINGQYVYWNGKTNGAPGTLMNVPPTGTGALISNMPSGASIVTVPSVVVQPSQAALAAGASAQLVVQRDDATAQSALAALEGGDGIHEFEVEDTRIAAIGTLQALGDAELAVGKSVIESATYISEDRNAQVGAVQAITLTGVNTSLPISSVRIYWIRGRRLPQRDVTTATVQKTLYQFLADLYDSSRFAH